MLRQGRTAARERGTIVVMRPSLVALSLAAVIGCRSVPQIAASASSTAPPSAPPSAPTPAARAPSAPPPSAPPPSSPPPATASAGSRPPTPKPRPATKQACSACGGLWDRHGISEVESCVCKTKDGGRACRDGSDCEGQCLAGSDAAFEVLDRGPPPRGNYVGRCSDYDTTFGCIRVIPRGARARGAVPADLAAQDICVD